MGSCPGGRNYSGVIVLGEKSRGNCPGGHFIGGNCPGAVVQGRIAIGPFFMK